MLRLRRREGRTDRLVSQYGLRTGPFGITVNMVALGWIPVERHANDPREAKDGYLAKIPAGRWGTPGDVAHAVNFFASEEASFITGQTLHVNGGHTPW